MTLLLAVCWHWCRLSLCESELALSESKVSELNRALTLMKEAEKESAKLHKAEMTRAHEVVTAFIICISYFFACNTICSVQLFHVKN